MMGDRSRVKRLEPSIAWRNLRFEAGQWFGRRRKVILNRLNGCFDYHTLNAFMGPSGAGKTTLLNCLNGNRVKGLTPESEIYLNKDQRDGKVVSYFIEQHVERTIVGRMRVGQILRYAYRFKNGNKGDMEGHIRKTIDELLLDELVLHRNFEQCSGGEQKRVAIAQELMSLQKPTLLFVDEPTTGLDSNAAHLVMKCLRQLATNHRMAIITSIHVPSDDILTLFDKLYVLAKGGVCIYSGRPDQLRSHLETQIESLVIPEEQPPIEAFTKIACSGITDPRVVSLSSHTLSEEYHNVTTRLSQLEPFPNGVPNHRKNFSFSDLYIHFQRMFHITFLCEVRMFLLQPLLAIFCLLFMVSLFDDRMVKPNGCFSLNLLSDNDTMSSTTSDSVCINQIENNSVLMQNILYVGLSIFFFGLVTMTLCVTLFAPMVLVFQNEHRNQWYSLGVFYWSFTVVGLAQVSLYSIFYSLFGYIYSGQHHADHFALNWYRILLFTLFFTILGIYSQSLGQLVGTWFMEYIDMGIVFTQITFMSISIFAGFYIDLEFSKNILVHFGKELFQFNSIFQGILYTLYGYDRCDPGTEYSLVLVKYHMETFIGNSVFVQYFLGVLVNVVVIRLTTLTYLYWRFNSFGKRSHQKFLKQEMVPIVFDGTKSINPNENLEKDNKITIVEKRKSPEEIEFETFSRGKILLAWRELSLLRTNFIVEQNLSLTLDESLPEKKILKNLSGHLRFGTLNGLMGTSGAGKTSLLKVLNGRDKTRISAQSQFYLSKFTRIQTCFITQDVSGHLLPGLTAKQMLVYASRLKNSQLRECGVDTSKIDHQQIALNLLDELDLSDTVDTPVEKCSGGERKRLALALELTALQKPNLICIDEPTSGLDSNSAEVVVAYLRKLTQNHCITIVASIHQPNTEVLLMFDQIYVLARGGVCIYSGSPNAIQPHLETVSEISSLDSKFPIESLIKHSCHSYPDPIVNQLMSTNHQQFIENVVDSGLLEQQTQPVADGVQRNRRRFSLEDCWILCARYIAYVRGYLWIELLAFVLLAFGYAYFLFLFFDSRIAIPSGCISVDEDFNNTCAKTEQKIEEESLITYNFQFIYFAFILFVSIAVLKSTLSFATESVHFFNEHHNGWYSTGSFYLAKSLFDTVPALLAILGYVHICDIYSATIPGIYLHLVLIMLLTVIVYHPVSYISSLMVNGRIPPLATLSVLLYFMFCFLSNYYIPIRRVHYFYRLLSNLSPVRFMFECTVLLQYGFGRCLPKQIQPLLYLFSLDDSDYYHNLWALLLLCIIYHTVAISLLVHLANPDQNRRAHIERVNDHCRKLGPIDTLFSGIGTSSHQLRIKLIRF